MQPRADLRRADATALDADHRRVRAPAARRRASRRARHRRVSPAHRGGQRRAERVHPRHGRRGARAGARGRSRARRRTRSRTAARRADLDQGPDRRRAARRRPPRRACARATSPSATRPRSSHLRQAGAVFVGKTNLHEFAFGTTNEESAFGPARQSARRDPIAGRLERWVGDQRRRRHGARHASAPTPAARSAFRPPPAASSA